MANLVNTINDRYGAADAWLEKKRTEWDRYDNLFHNRLDDKISSTTDNNVFDPKMSTFLLERSYRVMGQLMTGKVRGISRNDQGDAELKNLILDKYILPNANAQFDFLTKCRMVNTYSNIYGNYFVLCDLDVRPDGYIGPDMWLIPIRDVFPQVGAVSLEDSEYIIVRSWRTLSYFKGLEKRDNFQNIGKIVRKLEQMSGSKNQRDQDKKSPREIQEYDDSPSVKGKGYYEVLSMYERDRWVDYVVDAKEVFRDGKNAHEDDDLPVVNKYSIPLIDDFMAMGDFERGAPMQLTINSAWNLYLAAVKMSIFPPVVLNKDNMAVPSSFKFAPAAKWIGRGQVNNVAQSIQLNPQGIATFNNTYQVANASLLNLFGTTDTATTAETDSNFGKTPQALKMQSARENARDVTDRFYMEMFLKKVVKKFVNIMNKKQSKAISIRMFPEEIDRLSRDYPEIKEMYSPDSGMLKVKKGKNSSMLYDYEITPGSTYAVDQVKQQENLVNMFTLLTSGLQAGPTGGVSSPLMQALEAEGVNVKLGQFFKRIITNSGIQDWDEIIEEKKPEDVLDSQLNQQMLQFQAMLQQAQQGGGMNEIPTTPNGAPTQPTNGVPTGGGAI